MSGELKNGIRILVRQVVLELMIKIIVCIFLINNSRSAAPITLPESIFLFLTCFICLLPISFALSSFCLFSFSFCLWKVHFNRQPSYFLVVFLYEVMKKSQQRNFLLTLLIFCDLQTYWKMSYRGISFKNNSDLLDQIIISLETNKQNAWV